VAQSARGLPILAIASSTRGNKRVEFESRDFIASIHIRRRVVQNTSPEELGRSNFVGQPLTLDLLKGKLKQVAGGRQTRLGVAYE